MDGVHRCRERFRVRSQTIKCADDDPLQSVGHVTIRAHAAISRKKELLRPTPRTIDAVRCGRLPSTISSSMSAVNVKRPPGPRLSARLAPGCSCRR
jgi:hypothetical protein